MQRAGAAARGAQPSPAAPRFQPCPLALSLYALPKTGSSFLGRFLKALAVYLHVCMVLELKADCGTLIRVGCPPEWGGRRAAPLGACLSKSSEGCSWGWMFSITEPLALSCCPSEAASMPHLLGWQPGNDSVYADCSRSMMTSVLRQQHPPSSAGTLNDVLAKSGFVRGPLRQLPVQVGKFLPHLKLRQIVVLHSRHPIEAMVSLFFCISDRAVCPIRQNYSKISPSAANGVDNFLLHDFDGGPGSHLNRLLVKYEILAELWLKAQGSSESTSNLKVVQSRYELMVENFSVWLQQLVGALQLAPGTSQTIINGLHAQYRADFQPDGKHKHSLHAGSNLARLQSSTLDELSRLPRLRMVMHALNYSFSPNVSMATSFTRVNLVPEQQVSCFAPTPESRVLIQNHSYTGMRLRRKRDGDRLSGTLLGVGGKTGARA